MSLAIARATGVAKVLRALGASSGVSSTPSVLAVRTAPLPAISKVPTTPAPSSFTASICDLVSVGSSVVSLPSISISTRASPTLIISPTLP